MKKLLSLTICLALIFGVIAVNTVSFSAVEVPAEDDSTVAEPLTADDETVASDAESATEDTAPAADDHELAEVGAPVDVQETGDIAPVNLGKNFYARVKLLKDNSYYLTAPSKAAQTPVTRKATGYSNQVWNFVLEGSFYRIRNVALNSYLEMKDSVAQDGDTLYFTSKRNAAEQKWIISKDATGYRIHSYVDNNYVLVAVNHASSSSQIQLTSDMTNEFIYFSFEKIAITSDKLPTPVVKLSNHYNGVLVDWNDVANAQKYRVYRYNDSTKQWDMLSEVAESQYIDKKVSSNNTYKYAVRTISPVMSDFEAKSIKYIAAPRISVNNTVDGPVISWKKVAGAERYRVFMRSGTKWVGIATTVGPAYLHKAAEKNRTYVYTVRCMSANGKFISAFNTAGVSNMIVATPSPKVSVMPFSLDVSWDNIAGAAKYRVFCKCKANNMTWTKVADVVGTSHRYSDVVNGNYYYFTVRALNAKGQMISGFKSTAATYFYDAPVVKTITSSGTVNKLSWYPVKGAYKYRVFAWNGKQWVKKGDTAAYTTTFNASVVGTKEQNICYAVRCMDKNGNYLSSYLAAVIEAGLRYYFPGEYTSTHKF